MSGYKLMAESYRKQLDSDLDEESIVKINQKIKGYEFLATCCNAEVYDLFDSGAFNSICKGYFRKAMINSGIDPDKIRDVLYEFSDLLEFMSAEQADKF